MTCRNNQHGREAGLCRLHHRDFVVGLIRAEGVDDLDVTTDEKGGTAVSAGKYLNDRTYLSIQKGDKPGSGKARIDLDVGRGLKLRGEASDAGEAKGGIFYEKEY